MTHTSRVNKWLFGGLFTVVLCLMLFFFCDGINGNDFWWHVKAGAWMVQNRCVPNHDIFSWYAMEQGFSWTAHEWLSEVVFYLIFNKFGETGVWLLALGMSCLLYGFMWNHTKKTMQKNMLLSAVFYVFYAVVSMVFFCGRPQIFSYLLLFLVLKILYGYYEGSICKGVYLLPLVSMLWSNFHGGSSNLPYLLCILFLLTGMFTFQIGCVKAERKEKVWLLRLGLVTVCCMAAVVCNPNGIEMLFYPYKNMSDSFMLSVITEWHAPDAKNLAQLFLFFAPIGFMGIGFVSEEKEIRLIDGIVMAVFFYLFLRSVRFIMLWYIAAGFCAFRYMPECKIKDIQGKKEVFVCVILTFSILFMGITTVVKGVSFLQEEEKISKVISKDIIEVVKEEQPERLYNDYNFGETLIFEDIPVFIDARADLYSENGILDDAYALLMLQFQDEAGEKMQGIQELMEQYRFDAFLIGKTRPLYTYLSAFPEAYTLLYQNDTAAYFKVKNVLPETGIH